MAAHQISSGELRDYALIVECRRLAGCAAGFGQHLVGMFAEQRGEAPERRRRARETRRRDSYSRRERQVLAFHEAQASPARCGLKRRLQEGGLEYRLRPRTKLTAVRRSGSG
jgi:hypothetical protein